LVPLELGIIAVMGVVLLLWGPQKIPDLARALGRAKKEFDAASKEFQKAANIQSPGNSLSALFAAPASQPQPGPFPRQPVAPAAETAPPPPPKPTGDELLIDTARKLGIVTQGKTREQVQQEIIDLAKKAPDGSAASKPSETSAPS
jgi:sec-independent protein translocase protein TatA